MEYKKSIIVSMNSNFSVERKMFPNCFYSMKLKKKPRQRNVLKSFVEVIKNMTKTQQTLKFQNGLCKNQRAFDLEISIEMYG